jgi:hypothetical protein
MWVTLFALATAASVRFSAANVAVQLRNDQALAHSAIESRGQPKDASQYFSSALRSNAVPAALQID